MKYLRKTDPVMLSLIKKEQTRQEETLMMIPSENIASRAVEEAVGSCLGNKYAEGYPFKRYYQGQQYVDQIEDLVRERAKKLFNVPFVNVQPLSGSPANFAVYTALLSPGDTLMGLALKSGGHLTHGAPMNASSKYFNAVQYGLDPDGKIDFNEIARIAKKNKPKIIVAGYTAYPLILDWKKFAEIAESVGAYLMTDIAHVAGLIIGGVYPSPVPYAHVVTTTTHKTLRGPRGAMIMVTNKGLKKDSELSNKINKAIIPGIQGGPHLNTIAGIGVALKEASTARYRQYTKQIVENAKTLAEELKKYGLVLIGNGTECHLMLVDLRPLNILGNTAAEALEAVNIVLNRNGIPNDPNPPFYPSGMRLGTPGVTSRGMKKREMKLVARLIHETVTRIADTKKKLAVSNMEERKKSVRTNLIKQTIGLSAIQKQIVTLCREFPIQLVY